MTEKNQNCKLKLEPAATDTVGDRIAARQFTNNDEGLAQPTSPPLLRGEGTTIDPEGISHNACAPA